MFQSSSNRNLMFPERENRLFKKNNETVSGKQIHTPPVFLKNSIQLAENEEEMQAKTVPIQNERNNEKTQMRQSLFQPYLSNTAQINSSPTLEKEADDMGAKAAAGDNATTVNGNGSGVQKKEVEGEVENEQTTTAETTNNYTLTTSGDTITITLFDNDGNSHIKTLSINNVRKTNIVGSQNWNAIIKIMNFVASEISDFTYTVPKNLTGTDADNQLIIPDAGVIALLKFQANHILENNSPITASNFTIILHDIDGWPGDTFASYMDKDSINEVRDESGNTSMINENNETIDIPDFGSDSEETLYDFMRDITLARNGLWSDNDEIVNITGLRRELEISEEEDHEVQWNDTIAASWIETDEEGNEVKYCKHYTATTEPGNRDEHRMMRPQTATVLLGLHQNRQSAGRTKNILAQNSDNGNNVLKFEADAGMNFHPGGMRGYSVQQGSNNLKGGMVLTNQALSGLSGATGANTESQFEVQLKLSELFHILSNYGLNRTKSAYDHLKDSRDEIVALQNEQNDISDEQQIILNDYNRVESIMSSAEYTETRKNYIKNTVKFDINKEEEILDGDSTTQPWFNTSELNDGTQEVSTNISDSSKGCQVIYGGNKFYDFWWNTINKTEDSGQRRWYYTLINITTPYNEIETEEGNLDE